MAAADNTPDFDSMSPDEITRWLESLAKRQGANSEELVTSADMDIDEIDPESVVIDEPGYVPYGEERPAAPPRPATPPPPAVPPPSYPPPSADQPSALPPRPSAPPPRPVAPPPRSQPAAQPSEPSWRVVPQRESERPAAVETPAAALDDDALAWLESLAAGQDDALFNLDLNALTDEIEHRPAARAEEPTDPMAWLKSLANEEEPPPVAAPSAESAPPEPVPDAVTDPFESGVDPMAWLENLARRQGARDEELTTATEMNIPVPENPVIEEPGYTPFSFDAPIEPRRAVTEPAEPLDLDDPSEWLSSLADDQGFDESQIIAPEAVSMDIADIERAIADGTVTPEQMQVYLERETDAYVESLEDEFPEGEAPPVPAELPDWLLEQVGPPPASDEHRPPGPPPLSETIAEPPPPADLPDWLQEELPAEGEIDFDSIFANNDDSTFVAPDSGDYGGLTLEVDPADPWVEAFEAELEGDTASLETPPDWYLRNLNDPQRVAAVEEFGGNTLPDVDLPEETELPAGELIPVPEWFTGASAVQDEAASEEASVAEMPDWLVELESDVAPDSIPDWLTESMDEADADRPVPQPEPEPPVYQPAAPAMLQDDTPASEVLADARERARGGDIAAALDTYEALVRTSRDLDSVVADLQSLVRQHRSNPAVYRVLGDGLMRQGHLQSALDTYREALNLL